MSSTVATYSRAYIDVASPIKCTTAIEATAATWGRISGVFVVTYEFESGSDIPRNFATCRVTLHSVCDERRLFLLPKKAKDHMDLLRFLRSVHTQHDELMTELGSRGHAAAQ